MRRKLKAIERPTLISTRADPFMTEEVIPDESRLSRSVTLEVSEGGRRLHRRRLALNPHYYLPRRIIGFLQALLSDKEPAERGDPAPGMRPPRR